MVIINKRQKELNDELGSYLDRRKSESLSSSFFKKVESIIPSRSGSGDVPEMNNTESTVYEKSGKKRFPLFSIFSRGSRKVSDYEKAEDSENLPKEDFEKVEEDIDEVQEESEEVETKRMNLFQRLFSFLSSRPRPEESQEEVPEDKVQEQIERQEEKDSLYTETRETLKILHKWVDRLPPEQIEAFKRSPDFRRYKDLLDKYNLIK